MAADGAELRNLVARTLETQGVLGKIRAELRAAVFLALDEQGALESPLVNKSLTSFLSSENGMLVMDLVQEFLNFFHLDYTYNVLQPETGCKGMALPDRTVLAEKLSLSETATSANEPLLSLLLSSASRGTGHAKTSAQPTSTPAAVGSTDGGAFFSPTSRIPLAVSMAGRTTHDPDGARAGAPSASSDAAVATTAPQHVRSTDAQPLSAILSPIAGTTQSHSTSPDVLASYGLSESAIGGASAATSADTAATTTTSRAQPSDHVSHLLDFVGIDRQARSDQEPAGTLSELQHGRKTSTGADAAHGSKTRQPPASSALDSSLSSANESHRTDSDLSLASVHSHSRSESRGTAGVHDASKTGTTSMSQHKYSNEDFLSSSSSRSQVSSIANNVQDDTLTGSASDSSWLNRPADHPSNNLDTSDHSISQLSDGEFSYAEDIGT
eukprot:scpid68086/ scgid12619/ FGFR1 oncogene partner